MTPLPSISAATLWGVGLALVSMLTYGGCMVVVSVAMKGVGSGPGSLLAAAAGVPVGLLVVLAQLAGGRDVAMPDGWALCSFALAGICSTYLGRWLVFRSIELIGPSGSSGLQSTSPLLTAVFGWIFLGEAIGAVGFAGIALGIAGLVAMSVGIGRSQQGPAGARPSLQRGFVGMTLLVGVASAAAYSGSHIFRASAVRHWNEPVIGATLGAVAGLLALALAGRRRLADHVRELRANPAGARVYACVGGLQFVAQVLVIASMRFIPASVAALISMCTPLVVMPTSYFALGNQERVSPVTVLGICITLAGIALVILFGAGRT